MALEFDLLQLLCDHGLAHSIGLPPKTASDYIRCHDMVQGLSMHPSFRVEWVRAYPDLGWNMVWVSRCVRDINVVVRNPDAGWVFGCGGLSSNPNFDIAWLERLPGKPWSFDASNGLSACANVCRGWLRRHPRRPWRMGVRGVSRHSRRVTPKWLAAEPTRGWDVSAAGLAGNPCFDIAWVAALAPAVPPDAWDWGAIQKHPNFRPAWAARVPADRFCRWTISRNGSFRPGWMAVVDRKRAARGLVTANNDYVQNKWPFLASAACNHLYQPSWSPPDARRLPERFGMCALGSYVHFDVKWVKRFPDSEGEWDWGLGGVSSHPNFQFRWLLRYPDKPWFFGAGGISSRPNLDLSWILQRPDAGWCFNTVSEAPKLTLEWILALPEKPWNFCKLTSAPNFAFSWVVALPDRPWRVRRLRPVVTFAEDRRRVRERRRRVAVLLARGLAPVAPWAAALVWPCLTSCARRGSYPN